MPIMVKPIVEASGSSDASVTYSAGVCTPRATVRERLMRPYRHGRSPNAAGLRYVCEELDEQSLDVSLDAVRDTATSEIDS